MTRKSLTGLAGLVLVLAAASSGRLGRSEQPMRIGVLADCRGLFAGLQDLMLGGAELPLLQHGAHLVGTGASGGVTGASVAGRPVELVRGCPELGVDPVLVEETRRLIEVEHVDAVVGTVGGGEAIVLRDLARRYPKVPFVLAGASRREATLIHPAPNLFRFHPDDAQVAAGLGTYAYEQLGWRTAQIVADDESLGWSQAAAFAAEFCGLGGRIVERQWASPFVPLRPKVRSHVDGVAALVALAPQAPTYVREIARRLGAPARRLIVSPRIVEDPVYAAAVGRAAEGATTSSAVPVPQPSDAAKRFERAYRRAFPTAPPEFADGLITREYYDAVAALINALEQHGPLLRALAHVRLSEPGGTIYLDRNRQAVVATELLRIGAGSRRFSRIRTIGPVDQTLGGALRARAVGPETDVCEHAHTAPWASG
jgi:branched-chain amino acid transport system substrate-binding protein